MKSPCKGICKIEPDTGNCVGCFRTIYEIEAWTHLREEQQLAIIRRNKSSVEMKEILNALITYYDEHLGEGKIQNIIDRARKFKE